MIEKHLGGHAGKTCVDPAILKDIKNKYNIQSMIDIGCGPGGMQKVAKDAGITWHGIDGDYTVVQNTDITTLHDFTKGKPALKNKYDLSWSVEFLEHVEEKYMDNYMYVFSLSDYICCTAAPTGATGHHHVNCKDLDYWKDAFGQYGYTYDESYTDHLKQISVMRKNFYKRSGMFFYK